MSRILTEEDQLIELLKSTNLLQREVIGKQKEIIDTLEEILLEKDRIIEDLLGQGNG